MKLDLLKRVGFVAGFVFGWFGLFISFVSAVFFALPLHSTLLMSLGVVVALPFFIYPLWWVGISFLAGWIARVFWEKLKRGGER